jgi:hypothetical protein
MTDKQEERIIGAVESAAFFIVAVISLAILMLLFIDIVMLSDILKAVRK